MRAVSVLSAALLCCSVGAARANVITYDFSLPLSTASWVDSVSYALFNPSLGTLNSAELSASITSSASYQLQNLASASTFVVRPTVDLGLYFADDTPVIDTVVTGALGIVSLPANDGLTGPASAAYTAGSGLAGFGTLDTLLTDPTSLSYFTGVGDTTLYIVAQDMSSIGGGLFSGQIANNVAADVTLTLTYTPHAPGPGAGSVVLPEPGAAAVFGVACLALLGVRRRVRR